MKTLLAIVATLLTLTSCDKLLGPDEDPYQPLREDVWLYPEDLLGSTAINGGPSTTYYFDYPHTDYESRKGGTVNIYQFSQRDSTYLWYDMRVMGEVYDPQNSMFNKLALTTFTKEDWQYITFEWDTE